jgi:predicted amino acid dehydrogenase
LRAVCATVPDGTVAHTARMHTRIHDMLPHPSHNICSCFTSCLPVILARNMSAP